MTDLLQYEVVDVFTDRAFAGNPLAVVLGADELSTGRLQALAREFNLSETAFPMAADQPGADYRLRIFTPATELPFAGHPSVGAADVLLRAGRIAPGPVVQSCGAGLLPLDVTAEAVTLTGAPPSGGEPVPPGPLLAALGLAAGDLAGPPRRVACGIGFTVVPVHRPALARCAPDLAAVAAAGGAGVSAVAWDGGTARCRVYAAGAGVPEDPATGSHALALGAHLVAAGALPPEGTSAYEVVQGVEMGRPSRLSCTVTAHGGRAVRVTVRGSTVAVARGTIAVPPP